MATPACRLHVVPEFTMHDRSLLLTLPGGRRVSPGAFSCAPPHATLPVVPIVKQSERRRSGLGCFLPTAFFFFRLPLPARRPRPLLPHSAARQACKATSWPFAAWRAFQARRLPSGRRARKKTRRSTMLRSRDGGGTRNEPLLFSRRPRAGAIGRVRHLA
jgi:hypothetical protein